MAIPLSKDFINSEIRCIVMRLIADSVINIPQDEIPRIKDILMRARKEIGGDFVSDEKFAGLCKNAKSARNHASRCNKKKKVAV